jgi:hypothetical protein
VRERISLYSGESEIHDSERSWPAADIRPAENMARRGREPVMGEVAFVMRNADDSLRQRPETEINAFNAAAEEEIGRRGCDQVALSTHSFQAPGFYARFGYQECGRTPAYPRGHEQFHLVKRFR